MNDYDLLYYLHIPKTAGTTFTSILDSFYDQNSIFPVRIWGELLQILPVSFLKYKLLRGHFGYGIRRILPERTLIITTLRKPVERTISFFDHMKLEPIRNNWVSEHFLKINETLDEIMENDEKNRVFANNQTRHIMSDFQVQNNTNLMSKLFKKKYFFEEDKNFTTNTSNKLLLEKAKDRILQFAYIGIQEKFEESLFLLYYTFGWRPIKDIWRLMIAPKKTKLSTLKHSTIKKLEEYLKLDTELYEFAIKLFDKRFAQMVNDLTEKYYEKKYDQLSFKEMMYEMLEKHYQQRIKNCSGSLSQSIDFNFSQRMFGTGWYYREIHPDNNIAYRWSGPGKISTVDLPIECNTNMKIQFRVIAQALPEILNSIKVKIEGDVIDLIISNQNMDENQVFDGVNPTTFEGIALRQQICTSKKFVRISFFIDQTVNLHQFNPLYDERLRGIAMDKIVIHPHQNKTKNDLLIENISKIYLNILKRRADVFGLTYYFNQIKDNKLKLSDIENILKNSDECKNLPS